MIYLGMDVHKDSITIAVLPALAKAPCGRIHKMQRRSRCFHSSADRFM